MKKIINLSLVIMVSFLLASCCCFNCNKDSKLNEDAETNQILDDELNDAVDEAEELEDNLEEELNSLNDQI